MIHRTSFAKHAAVLSLVAAAAGCVMPGRTAAPSRLGAEAMPGMGHAGHHARLGARAFPRLWVRGEQAKPGAHVVVVKMVTMDDGDGGKFDPENIVAAPGDTVRFVTDGLAPHNVSFPAGQNVGLHPPAPVPFLGTAGQSYDLVVTVAPGTYHLQCDPHATTGMTGTLTVRR
jgi:plastocyanin